MPRKQLSVGDKVYYKPNRYSYNLFQPWVIIQATSANQPPLLYLIESKNKYRTHWVKQNSPSIIEATGGEDQCRTFESNLTFHNKNWDNLEVGAYYRRYVPRFRSPDGFIYYKIYKKTEPDRTIGENYYKVYFKVYHGPKYTSLYQDHVSTTTTTAKIFGRNFKMIPKLEGMLKMGE